MSPHGVSSICDLCHHHLECGTACHNSIKRGVAYEMGKVKDPRHLWQMGTGRQEGRQCQQGAAKCSGTTSRRSVRILTLYKISCPR